MVCHILTHTRQGEVAARGRFRRPRGMEWPVTLIKWSQEGDGEDAARSVRLGLPGDLDLAMAQPLVDSLRAGFQAAPRVTVEAAEVERVSTACVQALLVAARHAAEHNLAFAIARPSEALVEACDDLGLGIWLKQWSRA